MNRYASFEGYNEQDAGNFTRCQYPSQCPDQGPYKLFEELITGIYQEKYEKSILVFNSFAIELSER